MLMIAEEQKRNHLFKYKTKYYYNSINLNRFRTNESFVLIRFGELTRLINASKELHDTIESILWQYDIKTYLMHKIGIYDELSGRYNWQIIAMVNKLNNLILFLRIY
jgi:hypothetical protein